MNKIKFLLFIIASGVWFQGLAQKVKYKDLFLLLNTKQYDQAEPFLKRYLKENDDNPNAYLFMGIIYQEKSAKTDVIKATETLNQNTDSAVYFYDLAFKTITEKELKRNNDYYQMYNRRDMRTGEFGVTLSDVQFDLEKKIKTLKERKEKVTQLKTHYQQAELLYSRSMAQFKFLVSRYQSEKEFYLRADDDQNTALYGIINVFDSCITAFTNYKAVSQSLGKTGYNQTLNLIEIREYGKDGFSKVDFMNEDLRLWDYKRWAEHSLDVIAKDIKPLREQLISFDIEINKLRERLKKDSVSVKSELAQHADKLNFAQLRKYDADPMPLQVFAMKIAELGYISEILVSRPTKDSANAQLQLVNITREMAALKKLDSITTGLTNRRFEEDVNNYIHFVKSSYGTTPVLKSLISTTREYAAREKLKKDKELNKKTEAFKWLVVASDSVPLVATPDRETKFKPLIIVDEKYTAGFIYTDSVATGYFYRITPSRIPDVKLKFPVDKAAFKKRNFPVSKALSITDAKEQLYFICFYSETRMKEKFPVTLVKISKPDGLAWSNTYTLDQLPTELSYDADSGELAVKVTTGAGEMKLVIFDKAGKLVSNN